VWLVTLLLLVSPAKRALDINFEFVRVARPNTVSRFVPIGKHAFKRVFEVMRPVAWRELVRPLRPLGFGQPEQALAVSQPGDSA
jgi:hypothetical protein